MLSTSEQRALDLLMTAMKEIQERAAWFAKPGKGGRPRKRAVEACSWIEGHARGTVDRATDILYRDRLQREARDAER